MRALLNRLTAHKATALIILLGGFVTQAFTWLITLPLLITGGLSAFAEVLVTIWTVAWFCIPLVSLLGIYAGIVYQRRHGMSKTAIAGVILNTLWLAGFLAVVYAVFVIGITA